MICFYRSNKNILVLKGDKMHQITINFQDGKTVVVSDKYLVNTRTCATQKANIAINKWVREQYTKTGKTQRANLTKDGNTWAVTSISIG